MLALPAETGFCSQRLFHHRTAVDEHPVMECANSSFNALGQLLQAAAHQLVVVTPQGVTRDIGTLGFLQQLGQRLVFARQVVHAHHDHAPGAGHELRGPRAPPAMAVHVVHCAVITSGQPGFQLDFRVGQIG